MTRKLVTIRQIADIRALPNSPRLEIAVVDGWTCAVRTGVFTKGELILFFEIDSFLPSPEVDNRYGPDSNPLHNGLTTWQGSKGIHVKSVMVSKSQEISQGVVLKLSAFSGVESTYLEFAEVFGPQVGKEKVMEICFAKELGIKKWQLAETQATTSLGQPPVFFPKTDIERVQNFKTLFTNKYANAVFQESVKMDGSSMTVYFVKRDSQFYKSLPTLSPNAKPDMATGRFGVCSRNHDLNVDGKGKFWEVALQHGLPGKLAQVGRNIAIQGELVGSTINSNRHGFKAGEHDFYVFAIFDIDKQEYFRPDETMYRATQLELKHVPVLGNFKIRDIATDQNDLLKRAEGIGMNGRKREGLVYKNLQDCRGFKVIANNYLLTHGE